MRCALTISYNGKEFFGSQRQKLYKNTVLGVLEHVLSQLNINYKVRASGRTDKGVHATGQVCHIDLPSFWNDLVKLRRVLNEMLPPSIYVKAIKWVDNDFHARYSAKKRVYRYVIKEAQSNPFEDDFITFLPKVDFEKIQKNIKLFIGTHNFKYFMKSGASVKTTTRVMNKAFAYKYRGYIILNFEANGFLYSQIRLMVGALLKFEEKEILELLNCKKQHKIKPAKSNGLYLSKIKYI